MLRTSPLCNYFVFFKYITNSRCLSTLFSALCCFGAQFTLLSFSLPALLGAKRRTMYPPLRVPYSLIGRGTLCARQLKAITLFAGGGLYHLHFAAAWPMRSYRVLLYNGHSFLPCHICMAGKLCYTKVYLKTKKMTDISQTQAGFKAKSRRNPLWIPRFFNAKSGCVCRNKLNFRLFRYT